MSTAAVSPSAAPAAVRAPRARRGRHLPVGARRRSRPMAALAAVMDEAVATFGRAVLIDWHSMPARATNGVVDVVLGDRHGTSCEALLTRRLRRLFEAQGLTVGLNRPYAGGYATQTWGRPDEGFQAVQIELSRGLYWDEAAWAPSPAPSSATTSAAATRPPAH